MGSDRLRRTAAAGWAALAAWFLLAASASAAESPAVAVRLEPFILAPAHTPSAVVVLHNGGRFDFSGTVRVEAPASWRIEPAVQSVKLPARTTSRAVFTVRRGEIREDNAYPLAAVVAGVGGAAADARVELRHAQVVHVASAPFGKPKLDGNPTAIADAVPLTFGEPGRKTTISTLWNRKQFAVQVAVEQPKLTAWLGDTSGKACDAVQLAFAADASPTPESPQAACGRVELLLVALPSGSKGRCFLLATPETKLEATQVVAPLPTRAMEDVEVVVRHHDGWTYYQCLIPFRRLGEITPGEGREFSLAVLVHDAAASGVRDLGAASGLWPWQRNRLAWSRWPGDSFPAQPPSPCDSRLPWGMCSSKY